MTLLMDYLNGKNKRKRLYKDKYWYENTFNSLGARWLICGLKACNLPMNFRFGSFSANSGWYEDAAYKALKNEYNPTFYLNDLMAQNLKNKHVESYEKLFYLDSQCDAKDISIEKIDNRKLDIILDCKGALWYALKDGKDYNTISLLEKYRELLNNDGVLMFDFYDQRKIDNKIYLLMGYNNKEKTIKRFGESSTKYYLQRTFGDSFIETNCKELAVDADEEHVLSKKMGIAIIPVKSIDFMIDKLKKEKKRL